MTFLWSHCPEGRGKGVPGGEAPATCRWAAGGSRWGWKLRCGPWAGAALGRQEWVGEGQGLNGGAVGSEGLRPRPGILGKNREQLE